MRLPCIYELGGSFRYVEYHYSGTHRVHKISSFKKTTYVTRIINEAEKGKTIHELASLLVDDEITYEDINEFIHELIDSQILKSELEVSVTGQDVFTVLIEKMQTCGIAEDIISKMQAINCLLNQIDRTPVGQSMNLYGEIISIVKTIGVSYESKFLFQTDMYKQPLKSSLSRQLVDNLHLAMEYLNKIPYISGQTTLTGFQKAFSEKYEEQEIPLSEALDTDLGLCYLRGNQDIPNDLLANIRYMPYTQRSIPQRSEISVFHGNLLKKYVMCIKDGSNAIELDENFIPIQNTKLDDLPSTVYAMGSLLNIDQKPYIYLKGIVGGAGNLLGRFCHLNENIETLCLDIASKEQELSPDVILAEITHLPESRVGNILFRPVLRKYEIPYLAKASVENDYVIPLSDLYISVFNGKLRIRSKKLNKEIIPLLTTAHNFAYNALPVYQFLCEYRMQFSRPGLYFHWDPIFDIFDYKPRIKYKNIVLARQAWRVKHEDIEDNKDSLIDYLKIHKIERYVVIPDSDNEQFIDFEDENSVKLFLSTLKKKKRLVIEEFLFNPSDTPIKDNVGNSYSNEFIIPFYKSY